MRVFVLLALSLNVISSISTIQFNKYIYKHFSTQVTTVVFMNLLVTFACLTSVKRPDLMILKHIPLKYMLFIGVSLCFCSLISNFSLLINSIGTYQCINTLSTPGTIFASILLFKRNYSKKIKQTSVQKKFLFKHNYQLFFILSYNLF
jgi:solute carrier family 35 protein E3